MNWPLVTLILVAVFTVSLVAFIDWPLAIWAFKYRKQQRKKNK
jgi:hypothetical protein